MIPAYVSPAAAEPLDPSRDPVQAHIGQRPTAARSVPAGFAAEAPPSGVAAWRPVPASRVLFVLNQLAVMSHNGVEITDALQATADHCRNRRLSASLRQIHEAVSSGESLSAAIASYGTFFPPTLAPMLAAAEATGEVPKTLRGACVRLRGELQLAGSILGALIYPAILIAASMVVLTALVLGVLPQFGKVFDSLGQPVPASTDLLLAVGEFARGYWPLLAAAAAATLALLIALRRHPVTRRPVARFLMYGPLIRDAYRPLAAGRCFRTIAAMVAGGVPMLQAVRLARRTTRDLYWQHLLQEVEQHLIDGLNASTAMMRADFLPPEAAQMMVTAERTGRVSEVLEDIGGFYQEEAARRIKRLIVIMEPCIILAMGVVVAGIVMSVVLPLLEISTMH
jgi:general secretion pathway protein F